MSINEFAALVNGLARGHCDDINAARPNALFKAVHRDYPEAMLAHYHARGLTPTQALAEIVSTGKSI